VERYGGLKKALANVLSFDYIGALFGSLLFPLVLLPELGFARTSFLIGLVNLAVAWVNLWVFREEIARVRLRLWGAAIATGVLLVIGFFFSTGWIEKAREAASGQKVVHLEHTPYQHIRFVREEGREAPIYRLFLNGEHQFSSDTERRYHEGLVHPAMSAAVKRERILVLGGGDGLALREIWRYREVKHVTMVDLDPAMTRFARNNPVMRKLNEEAFQEKRLHLLHQDAGIFLQQPLAKPFDVVIIDLPVPTQIGLSKLYTVHTYRLLRRVTHAQSVLATEAAVLNPLEYKPFWSMAATQEKAGWRIYPYTFETMAFLMFSRASLVPQALSLVLRPQSFAEAVLRSAFALPRDVIPRHPFPPNTLDTHHLMNLILELR
jgi:spermidine synthase